MERICTDLQSSISLGFETIWANDYAFPLYHGKRRRDSNAAQNHSFEIVDYELSLRWKTDYKQFSLSADFRYSHPVNGTLQDPVYDFFYTTITFSYDLPL
jgi:hypothetical protein